MRVIFPLSAGFMLSHTSGPHKMTCVTDRRPGGKTGRSAKCLFFPSKARRWALPSLVNLMKKFSTVL
jgi:hypothetical protein